MLMRFDPFREFDRPVQQRSGESREAAMPMDAYRQGDRFIVHFDLPGVDPDQIDLTVEKNVVTVKAERSWRPAEGQEVLIRERPQGTFTRQLFLGEGLDPEEVTASYEQGVLTLSIAVAQRATARKVEVTAGQKSEAVDTGSNGR